MDPWPVFICYRQSDGLKAADITYRLLKDQTLPTSFDSGNKAHQAYLDVYFDQAAPGVGDWTAIHEPYLKRARAMIVICTPGAKIIEGENDWVHLEIDWWLNNRNVSPILVDPLSQKDRYVPTNISRRWPKAQRIEIIEENWKRLSGQDIRLLEERTRSRLIEGILQSRGNVHRQELEKEKKRTKQLQDAIVKQKSLLKKLWVALIAMVLFFCIAVVGVIFSFKLQKTIEKDRDKLKDALETKERALFKNNFLEAQRHLRNENFLEASMLAFDSLRQIDSNPRLETAMQDISSSLEKIIFESMNRATIYHSCQGPKERIRHLSISPDNKYILASSGEEAFLWQTENCRLIKRLNDHRDIVSHTAWSPDSGSFITTSWDGVVTLYEADTQRKVRTVKAHEGRITDAQFSPDGSVLVTASYDGTAKVWNLKEGNFAINKTLNKHRGKVLKLTFSEKPKYLMTISEDARAFIWDTKNWFLKATLVGHKRRITSAGFFSEDKKTVTSSEDGTALIWTARVGKQILKFEKGDEAILSVSMSPNEKKLMTSTSEEICIWNVSSAKPLKILLNLHKEKNNSILSAEFLEDRFVITGDYKGHVKIWDLNLYEELLTIKGKTFSRQLFTISDDKSIIGVVNGQSINVKKIFLDIKKINSLICNGDPSNWNFGTQKLNKQIPFFKSVCFENS